MLTSFIINIFIIFIFWFGEDFFTLNIRHTSVFITINVNEGDVYKISSVELAGDLKIPEGIARALILLKEDMTFSQALMTTSSEYITRRLGNEGYTFAEVEGFPEVDEESKTAKVTFVVTLIVEW